MAPMMQDPITSELTVAALLPCRCLCGRDNICAAVRSTRSMLLAQRPARERVGTALSWCWVDAAKPSTRIGCAGGWVDSDCRCLLEFAITLVDDLLAGRALATAEALARIQGTICYALASDPNRLGLVEIAAPVKPAWMPMETDDPRTM
jgi:hypothetical protein